MSITFINKSRTNKIRLSFEKVDYCLEPQSSLDIPSVAEKAVFTCEIEPLDYVGEFKPDEFKAEKFKEKCLRKAATKFFEKMPEMALYTAITYEVQSTSEHAVVELNDAVYSACDGDVADFFDLMPALYCFPQAESSFCSIKPIKAKNANKKQYLKLQRKIMLFLYWGLLFLRIFEFIPAYAVLKYYISNFYITATLKKLYNLPRGEREILIAEKLGDEESNRPKKKKSLLKGFIKALIVIIILGGVIFWGMTSEPEVILSEDFSQIQCYDETFVKVDTPLPEDAKKVFLDEHTVYYILPDGEYDMENYYCYIYETESGERYLWLKDDCSLSENKNKQYEDYENPIVYKSVGETKAD